MRSINLGRFSSPLIWNVICSNCNMQLITRAPGVQWTHYISSKTDSREKSDIRHVTIKYSLDDLSSPGSKKEFEKRTCKNSIVRDNTPGSSYRTRQKAALRDWAITSNYILIGFPTLFVFVDFDTIGSSFRYDRLANYVKISHWLPWELSRFWKRGTHTCTELKRVQCAQKVFDDIYCDPV